MSEFVITLCLVAVTPVNTLIQPGPDVGNDELVLVLLDGFKCAQYVYVPKRSKRLKFGNGNIAAASQRNPSIPINNTFSFFFLLFSLLASH